MQRLSPCVVLEIYVRTESATAITEQFPVKTCFPSVEKACCGQNLHKLCKFMCKLTTSVKFKFQFLMFKLCKTPIFVLLPEAIIEILLKNHYFCAPVEVDAPVITWYDSG